MHNQYEWQHMLPEALAIVCRCRNPIVLLVTLFKPFMCSIKFDKTGFLSLTEAGLQEIGRCDQVSQSFIWVEANHFKFTHLCIISLRTN